MVTVSPPVSPSVVAAILMIQNPRVTAGTLLIVEWAFTRRTSRSFLRGQTSDKETSVVMRQNAHWCVRRVQSPGHAEDQRRQEHRGHQYSRYGGRRCRHAGLHLTRTACGAISNPCAVARRPG